MSATSSSARRRAARGELHHVRPPRPRVARRPVRLGDHLEPDGGHLDQQHARVPVRVERRPGILPVARLHPGVVDQAGPTDQRDVRRHAFREIVERHAGTRAQLPHLAAVGVCGQPHHPVPVRREGVHGAHRGMALVIQRRQRRERGPHHHLARDPEQFGARRRLGAGRARQGQRGHPRESRARHGHFTYFMYFTHFTYFTLPRSPASRRPPAGARVTH